MDTLTAITQRRSVKHFDTGHQMTEAEIDQLMAAALLSPTAFNIRNWRFVLVSDTELRRRIRAAAWDQAPVTDALLLIVLCADLKAWATTPAPWTAFLTPWPN
ncbi:MAG: hypothetical protein CTY34_10605 [Methylobacter sp.]|nr:MAG: hypothetical protein CTY34_10605 [Methylobacter sp.]